VCLDAVLRDWLVIIPSFAHYTSAKKAKTGVKSAAVWRVGGSKEALNATTSWPYLTQGLNKLGYVSRKARCTMPRIADAAVSYLKYNNMLLPDATFRLEQCNSLRL